MYIDSRMLGSALYDDNSSDSNDMWALFKIPSLPLSLCHSLFSSPSNTDIYCFVFISTLCMSVCLIPINLCFAYTQSNLNILKEKQKQCCHCSVFIMVQMNKTECETERKLTINKSKEQIIIKIQTADYKPPTTKSHRMKKMR